MKSRINKRKKLGELLCEKSYLDQSGLKYALAEQKVEHRPLGQILLELGYITQAHLNEALALQAGIEKVDFFVDSRYKATDYFEPYAWTWDEKTFFKHTIKVNVYDNAGNKASDEIVVWKFF